MKDNYTGIDRKYDKDRFFYYLYVDGKFIDKFVNFNDAECALKREKKESRVKLFKIAFGSILDKYKVDMSFENDKITVTFDDGITQSFSIDGNKINSEVFKID
jgi:hypothetical protein